MYQAMQQSGLKPSEKTIETIRACIPRGSSQFFRSFLSTGASFFVLGSATALIGKTDGLIYTLSFLLPELKQSIVDGAAERIFAIDDVLEAAKTMASLSYLDHAAELFRALFQSCEVEKFMHTVATRLFLLLLLLLLPRLMFLICRWHKTAIAC